MEPPHDPMAAAATAVEKLPGTVQRFYMKDGVRDVTLTGWMIGEADTQSGEDVRWTELRLYKTQTGRYVIEKIGRSDVFHSPDCSRNSKGKRYESLTEAIPPGTDEDTALEELFVPCEDCQPSYDVSPVFAERDISRISTFTTAADAVRSLYRGGSGASESGSLSRVARALLENASTRDENVKAIFTAPVEIR